MQSRERQRRSDLRRASASANLSAPPGVPTVMLTSHRGALDRWNHHRHHGIVIRFGSDNLRAVPDVATKSRRRTSRARLLCNISKRSHITPVLRSLHWLPVRFRVEYKVLLFVFKAINGMAPAFLAELITVYQPARTLRSSEHTSLADCDWSYRKGFTMTEWWRFSGPDLCGSSPRRAATARPPPVCHRERDYHTDTITSLQSTRCILDQSSTTIRYGPRSRDGERKGRTGEKGRRQCGPFGVHQCPERVRGMSYRTDHTEGRPLRRIAPTKGEIKSRMSGCLSEN
ncbi:hypothetical protein DPEC_G00346820 [Dallia pectoralis]|uniref:Uncharacterized protein n=1 Tax=Dallia pectoralis TaxID=75939 RepID=A0ACC2F3V9_DALPE|nr:hypothetical protein DPEC_G00346820 [Dallia pectoralis]